MIPKVLLDVNICLDVLLDRKPHVDHSGQLFEAAEKGTIEIFVSAISFDTMYDVMRLGTGGRKAIEKLKLLLKHIQIAGLDATIIEESLNAGWKDFENAMHYYSALHAGCKCVITRNPADFKVITIPVYTPGDFISRLL